MAETNGSPGNGNGAAGPEANGGGKLATVLAGAKEVKARATEELAGTVKAAACLLAGRRLHLLYQAHPRRLQFPSENHVARSPAGE